VATIELRVKPGSKTPGLSIEDGEFVLRVRARAADGAANADCVRALAGILGVPKRCVTLASGSRSRIKRFSIDACDRDDAERRLREAAEKA
jgi:hypothetical protein